MHSLVAVDCGFIHCSSGSVQVLVQCFIYIYILAVMDGKEGDVGVGPVGKARNT